MSSQHVSQWCLSISQRVPHSTTHFISHSLPQSSPFSSYSLYRGLKRRHSIFTQKLLFWGVAKVQVFFIKMLIKNQIILITDCILASTRLSNTYHSTFAASIQIILFSKMLKLSEFFLKEQILWRKILNIQEYFICWSENFKC